jgi:4-amino-4-deoxy-L-arabinose transferase-like glycosyltransferase
MTAAALDRPPSTDPAPPPDSALTPPSPAAGPGPDRRPGAPGVRRERLALAAVTAVSFALNAWRLDLNGLGNQYYAAAARSMGESWSNFFFVAFDPGGYLSIDKPPVALWVWGASARLFGVNSWGLLLPGALAGAGAVALLWVTVRRRFGPVAATVAAAVLAVSPVNVAVNRLNLPEPFLVLLLVAAAWALLRSFDARRALLWVGLAGVFVGLAFNTKMLAAFIPLPALGLALLAGTERWRDRIVRSLTFGITTLAVSASWMVAVDLTPAAARPWVGGSVDDTVRNLVIGYNGFGRVAGAGALGPTGPGGAGGAFGGRGAPGGGMAGAGGVLGGGAGPLRLVGDAVGGQIAWLLPLAALGAAAGLWLHRRDRHRRAALVLWTGWLVLYAAVFSFAEGTFHSYYTAVLGPGVAALVGIGAPAVVTLARRRRAWLAAALAAGAVTVVLQLVLSGRVPGFEGWTRPVLVIAALGAAAGVAVAVRRRRGRHLVAALAAGLAALLVTPAAWAVHETTAPPLNATLPQAGPRTGVAGSTFGSASSNGDPELAAWLRANAGGEEWDLVVASAQTASGLIADENVPVLALGGFMGTDPTTTVTGFADLVDAGRVRFVLTSAGAGPGGRGAFGAGGGNGGGASAARVVAAASSTCPAVADAPARYRGSLVDCAGRGAALRAAG